MDPRQIERARKEKRLYLLALLCTVTLNLAFRILGNRFPGGEGTVLLLSLANIAFIVIATWRFCRSIGIGTAWSVINAAISPFVFIVHLVVLLRIYAKRTRVRLTFLMGDQVAKAS